MRTVTPLKQWNFALEHMPFQPVTVPHDWAVAGPFARNNGSRMMRNDMNGKTYMMECCGETGGLPYIGKGTYVCSVPGPADPARRTFLDFEGVMSLSKVYVNGELAGARNYGYSSFRVNASRFLHAGENEIRVTAENLPESARWYPGAGIYRPVRMIETDPVYFDCYGLHVKYLESSKRLFIEGEIRNETGTPVTGKITLTSPLFDENAWECSIPAGSYHFAKTIALKEYRPWSVESPVLYDVRAEVTTPDCSDAVSLRYGIRTLKFDNSGFYLNGIRTRFNGVNMHHDLGPLGAAFNTAAAKRQIQILKEMGCNAIRTSHNPPAPGLLDLCDELGILVLDEAFDMWHLGKSKNDYHLFFDTDSDMDIADMVKRDRNHPCVVLWSIGNEIAEQLKPEDNGKAISARLAGVVRQYDTERPVTAGFNHSFDAIRNGLAENVDIAGWNYHPEIYNALHELLPDSPQIATESLSTVSSRGIYHFPAEEYIHIPGNECEDLQCSGYAMDMPSWANSADTEDVAQNEHPWMLGQFIWTGFDYLGEPTPYYFKWPARSSYFGCIDLVGLPKDLFYLVRSLWDKDGEPMLHIVPHDWNWGGMSDVPVHVFSNCQEIELFLNGRSLGRKTRLPRSGNLYRRTRFIWDRVPYEPGELKAVGYRSGEPCAEEILRTAGMPERLELFTDRTCCAPDGEDMLFVNVRVLDAHGVPCPKAVPFVTFSVRGDALRIAAADAGNATSTEPFPTPECTLFSGMAVVYLRSTGTAGKVCLTAQSEGLVPAELELTAG